MKTFMTGVFFTLIYTAQALAQNDVDALRYSMLRWNGSARFAGMSGAYSSLGADFSLLSVNPAGLGLYRSSELSLSMAFTGVGTSATFMQNNTEDSRLTFNIPGFGFVFSSDLTKKNRDNAWKRLNVGIGLNRTAEFNMDYFYSGINPSSSLIDYYVEEANQNGGVAPSQITNTYPFGAGMFYQAYLINPLPGDTLQYNGVVSGGNVWQSGNIMQHRNMTEMVISLGTNYDDRLLLGITLGLPDISYQSNQTFEEVDSNDVHPDFMKFSFQNRLSTDGSGINAKAGLTFLVNDYVRVGLALHSPTHFWMTDSYDAYIRGNTVSAGSHEWYSPLGRYDYQLTTPWRLIAGAAVMAGSHGLISVDYELVDYSAMRYRFRSLGSGDERNLERQINETIASKYTTSSTFRVGAEAVLDIFRLRLGAAYSTSPFAADIRPDDDLTRLSWSAGAGLRANRIFADAAVVWQQQQEFFQPYTLSTQEVPGVSLKKTLTDVVFTVGYRF